MMAPTRRLAVGARTVLVVVAVAAIVAGLPGPITPHPAAAESPGLEVVGELDLGCPPNFTGGITVIDIDTDARRLYTKSDCEDGDRIVVHDISTEIPTVTQVGPPITTTIRVWTSYTVLVAPDRQRLYVLGIGSTGRGEPMLMEVYDLETLEHVETWNMSEEKTSGFVPYGLDYDQARDRIYLVGMFGGSNLVNASSTTQSLATSGVPRGAVVAIDADSGESIWTDLLTDCDLPLRTAFQGAFVGRSSVQPMLYTFCEAGGLGSQPVGQAGLVRLDLKAQDDATGMVDFPSEFFPVSGHYREGNHGGVTSLDRSRERFFAQSISSRTHGAWVFDGLRSSWIGFVASPDDTNSYYGLDPTTGKYYMGGGKHLEGTGYINVTDGGATPVPQGRLFSDIRSTTPPASEVEGSLAIKSNMMVDPMTGRLFTSYHQGDARGALVLRDTTPPITPREPLDLDELTHDLADDEARLEFSANTSGFGAQYVQVGGWENVYSRLTVPGFGWTLAGEVGDNPANIRYGNRGATMSLVEGIGLASSGASASAVATRPDDNTPADAESKTNEATEPGGGLPSDGDDVEETEYATCLDGIGEPVTEEKGSEAEPFHAVAHCDLENLETTAFARASGGSGGGGLVVSDSSFDARTFRDPDRGIVTEAEAIAEGVFFGEADLGGFGIDRVTATTTTWANGLDGTSHVRWERTVEGMRTFEADGTAGELTSCTTIVESGEEDVEEGDCETIEDQLNALIPTRFEVKFPRPEAVATPGGAFASVQETESDFLSGQATNNDQRRAVPGMEVTVFADGPQRGRLWVQLAAVKADATFIRSPHPPPFDESTGGADTATTDEGGTTAPPAPPGEGESGTFDVPESSGPTGAPPVPIDEPDVAPDDGPPVVTAADETPLVAFGWLPALRSLGDAMLTGALYLLFLLPVAEIVRRRRLLDVLTDAGSADASPRSAQRSPARVPGSPVSVSGSPVGSTS